MVAQTSSAGGDRAPKRTPAAFLRPGDMVRVLTAPVAAPCVIVAVIYEHRLHGVFVLYRIAAGTVELLIDPANVVLIGEAATAPAHGPMCECGDDAADPAAEAVATAEPTEPEGTIEWARTSGGTAWVSSDGRFQIAAEKEGFVAQDLWCGARLKPAILTSASAWCEARKEGQPLKWKEDRSGYSANLPNARFRVNRVGADRFQAVDCRFSYTHRLHQSPIFDSLEPAQRWCEVRAACQVEGEGATATLHYVGPIPF
ncbi:hypothetical protein VT84_33310 [Gemmata sp. SH-PL17]|uniref:hypothetical protein n=1 Tax=Gemmata sp. SH-PL17 TaxID=1630693 RepID=UPI00078D1006|nr:hypothetical protein [Gemmata sp. SH-PL17]AMV29322.1 hypothetical protein VT84_33310 [Gemmata sp. SH-PL17]